MADELSLNYDLIILLSQGHLNPIKSSAKLDLLLHWNLVSSPSFVASFKNGALSESARSIAWPYTKSNQARTETYQEHPTVPAGQWRIPDCNSSQRYSPLHRTVSMHWQLRMAYTLHQRNFLSDLISPQEW